MALKALPDGYHISLSVSQNLWSDLLGQALPIQVGTGDFAVVEQSRNLLHMAEDQVKGLLNDVQEKMDEAPVLSAPPVKSLRARLKGIAKKGRKVVSARGRESVRVTGKWRADVAKEGSRFTYQEGGVTLDARVSMEVEGKAVLFGDQFEIPFRVGHSVDGAASLVGVGFNRDRRQLEGSLAGISLSLGRSLPLRLLKVLADRLIEQQIDRFNPLPLIPSNTLESMVLPAQGPLKMSAGIEDLHVGIDGQDLTLSVRFDFRSAA